MSKIKWQWIALAILLVSFLALGLYSKIQSYKLKQIDKLQFIALREFSEKQNQKIFLFKSVNYDYARFRLLDKIVELESSWRANVEGDKKKAFGLAQFHQPTFEQFKKEADMPELEYENPYHQLSLLVWAFENGKQNHWTTYRKAERLTKI